MAVASGNNIVKDGLILHLDIANRKSFIESGGQGSLVNTALWQDSIDTSYTGNTLANAGWVFNIDAVGETGREVATDPWGYSNVVWASYPSGNNNNDGGFHTPTVAIDKTKLYRFSVWTRRTSASYGGYAYFGPTGVSYPLTHIEASYPDGNPYWNWGGTNGYIQNQWYLQIGFIYPHTHTTPIVHPDSGWYTIQNGTTKVGINNLSTSDWKWNPLETQAGLRVYHFYCPDTTTRMQWMYPRIDIVDGTEPTIGELLNNSSGVFYDLSGYGNHHSLAGWQGNYYINHTNSPRKFTFNATQCIQKGGAMNGATTTNTVVMIYSTTDNQELWCRGNASGAHYLSAAYVGSGYYHSNCGGAITNYVDCKSCTDPVAAGYKDGNYHMWEAKNVDFSSWTTFQWFGYDVANGGWNLTGNLSAILVYNKVLSADESVRNFAAFRGRYGI